MLWVPQLVYSDKMHHVYQKKIYFAFSHFFQLLMCKATHFVMLGHNCLGEFWHTCIQFRWNRNTLGTYFTQAMIKPETSQKTRRHGKETTWTQLNYQHLQTYKLSFNKGKIWTSLPGGIANDEYHQVLKLSIEIHPFLLAIWEQKKLNMEIIIICNEMVLGLHEK
jgi:hypothetical protein